MQTEMLFPTAWTDVNSCETYEYQHFSFDGVDISGESTCIASVHSLKQRFLCKICYSMFSER